MPEGTWLIGLGLTACIVLCALRLVILLCLLVILGIVCDGTTFGTLDS